MGELGGGGSEVFSLTAAWQQRCFQSMGGAAGSSAWLNNRERRGLTRSAYCGRVVTKGGVPVVFTGWRQVHYFQQVVLSAMYVVTSEVFGERLDDVAISVEGCAFRSLQGGVLQRVPLPSRSTTSCPGEPFPKTWTTQPPVPVDGVDRLFGYLAVPGCLSPPCRGDRSFGFVGRQFGCIEDDPHPPNYRVLQGRHQPGDSSPDGWLRILRLAQALVITHRSCGVGADLGFRSGSPANICAQRGRDSGLLGMGRVAKSGSNCREWWTCLRAAEKGMMRSEEMAEASGQNMYSTTNSSYFCLVIAESCDVADNSEFLTFVRCINYNFYVFQELLGLDIFEALNIEKCDAGVVKLEWAKLESNCTDGAPCIVGKELVSVIEVWSGAGMKEWGKVEILEKTSRLMALTGTIPTCEKPETRTGIEPGSPWWEETVQTTELVLNDQSTYQDIFGPEHDLHTRETRKQRRCDDEVTKAYPQKAQNERGAGHLRQSGQRALSQAISAAAAPSTFRARPPY
ncbi:hypothetical protein PR048_019644 [Dryococelus australis]|uniref:Uncharacterized protein n=1 Tax=Dryococelus australis TaxID=614101 RepID=A0ABQ9H4D7_9NEOP|nr:hypothetical protein PR048_019644 [Dryococelus australis]